MDANIDNDDLEAVAGSGEMGQDLNWLIQRGCCFRNQHGTLGSQYIVDSMPFD